MKNPFPLLSGVRKLVLATVLAAISPLSWVCGEEGDVDPDLIAYEGFAYDAGSSIEYLSGGYGWGGFWGWRSMMPNGGNSAVIFNASIVQEQGLEYGDLVTSGRSVLLTGAEGELQLGRLLANSTAPEAGTSTYISFIGQRVGPAADITATGYQYGTNPYPRGASVRFFNSASERLSVGNFSNRMTIEENAWSVYGSNLVYTPSGESFTDAAAFVVVRIDHKGEGAGDNIYVWVNPDLDEPEDTATAQVRLEGLSNTSGEGVVTPHNIGAFNWVGPFAGHASVTAQGVVTRPHAEMLVDELRIGRTYASVTPTVEKWAGFELDDERMVDTGNFAGRVYASEYGWNWAYDLSSWFYLPSSWATAGGSWSYFYNLNSEEPGTGGSSWAGFPVFADTVETGSFLGQLYIGHEPWLWSYDLETWLYLAEEQVVEAVAMVYLFNSNPTSVLPPEQPVLPVPADGDAHADADGGMIHFSWSRGQGSDTHDVYFGMDAEAVAAATPEAEEFIGNLTETQVTVEHDFYALDTYYWRVDAVNEAGVAKGKVWSFQPRRLAFPGAEGYGRFAVGGRGGRVVTVTNLDDSGPGSLRWAIEDGEGPRIIVFGVGGIITLERHLTIAAKDHNITIAGQTAPGRGITIRKHKLGVSGTNDVILRFLRLRLGNMAESTSDGTGMQGAINCIMDHLSVSWSIDEGFSSRSAQNITLQRTMVSEALNQAGHQNYGPTAQHGYAASISGDIGSFHHNLLAHCAGRNWSLAGGLRGGRYAGRLDLRNNVVYNWRSRTTDGGAAEVNFVGNYYKGGASTTYQFFINPQHENLGTGSQRYFVEGNILDTNSKQVGPDSQAGGFTTDNDFPNAYVEEPFFESYVTTQSARHAYKLVLSDVGSNMPVVDNHDYRIIGETLGRSFTYSGSKTGYGGLIDNENDLGEPWVFYESSQRPAGWDSDGDGLPDWWEILAGTDPNSAAGDFSDTHADPDRDGWTHIDNYLHFMATPYVVCAPGGNVEMDISQLTRGFTDEPVHVVTGEESGTAELLADGTTVRFTPSIGFEGIGGFAFEVTDADGDSMTREVNVLVVEDLVFE